MKCRHGAASDEDNEHGSVVGTEVTVGMKITLAESSTQTPKAEGNIMLVAWSYVVILLVV